MALEYGTPEEAGMDPARIAMLRERIPTWEDSMRMRCGVLLASRHGKIVCHEAFGSLTWEDNSPIAGRDAIFRVASITKPVTAPLIMILVEDGLLGLNRPIKEYLPEVCGKGADDVEVQHLLTHTSGFGDEADTLFETASRDARADVNLYLASSWAVSLESDPGSRMEYAGHNYELLGEIVRRVSGMSLDDFACARLFSPLGMRDTTYERDTSKSQRIARRRKDLELPEGPWGSDGLYTTALDLAAFGQMFVDDGMGSSGRILSPASVREMTRNQIPGIGTEIGRAHV